MAKDKTGVVITLSMFEAIDPLPDEDRLAMYDAVARYGIKKKVPTLSGYLKSIFAVMKPNIDSSQNRYRASTENGAKGGAPIGNQNARKSRPKNNQTNNQKNNQDIDIDIDLDNNSNSDSNTSGKRMDDTDRLLKMFSLSPPTRGG